MIESSSVENIYNLKTLRTCNFTLGAFSGSVTSSSEMFFLMLVNCHVNCPQHCTWCSTHFKRLCSQLSRLRKNIWSPLFCAFWIEQEVLKGRDDPSRSGFLKGKFKLILMCLSLSFNFIFEFIIFMFNLKVPSDW